MGFANSYSKPLGSEILEGLSGLHLTQFDATSAHNDIYDINEQIRTAFYEKFSICFSGHIELPCNRSGMGFKPVLQPVLNVQGVGHYQLFLERHQLKDYSTKVKPS